MEEEVILYCLSEGCQKTTLEGGDNIWDYDIDRSDRIAEGLVASRMGYCPDHGGHPNS